MKADMLDQPLLTIVVPNYNFGHLLEESLRSIFNQSCNDYEVIVVDGGSTDNSVEVIKKYEHRLAWWCSEKDNGQSEAFNKGFKRAKGKYLTWLNSDDLMMPGTISRLQIAHNKTPNCDWFTGNMLRFLDSSNRICDIAWGPNFSPECLQTKRSPIVVFGPTSFFSKKVLLQIGFMNENYHHGMDTELWYRMITAGIKQRRVRHVCWGFRMHELSKTAEFDGHVRSELLIKRGRDESNRIRKEFASNVCQLYVMLTKVLRLIDGSLFYGWFLRKRLLHTRVSDYIKMELQKENQETV